MFTKQQRRYMMETYKTYQEAVLENGSDNGVYQNLQTKRFSSDTLIPGNWIECNPADYLESLESFLTSGKRLVRGDLIITWDGSVYKACNESIMNKPDSDDKLRFVLQAVDQVETPEEKEAFDSIPNQTTIYSMNSEAEKESYNSTSEAFDAIDTTLQQVEWKHGDECVWEGKKAVFIGFLPSSLSMCLIELSEPSTRLYGVILVDDIGELTKPETPAEREERERWEAAYKLYCTLSDAIGRPTMTFEEFTAVKQPEGWLAVVDETGYRKQ